MKKLDSHLSEWTEKGLISKEQAQSIKQHEDGKTSKNYIVYGFLLLGATILGAGIISLIAANWYQIPDFVKLGIDFLILAGLGYSVFRNMDSEKKYIYEVLLTVFVLFVLGTIGLIAQIYQLGGKPYEAFFLWSVISLPAVMFSRKTYLPYLWSVIFLVSSSFVAANSHFFQHHFVVEALSWVFIITIVPVFCVFVCAFLNMLRKGERFIKISKELAILTSLLAIVTADIWISGKVVLWQAHEAVGPYSGLIFWLPCIVLAVSSLLVVYSKKMLSFRGRILLTLLILFHLLMFAIIVNMQDFSSTSFLKTHNQFSGAFLSITFLLLASFLAGVLGQRKIFQALVVFIGIRFLIVYFQAMGGLTKTGIGLVISGLVIIGMVYLWLKTRKHIEKIVERLER